MGNPSDGFFGKTISLSIRNFWAEVSISESSKLTLIPGNAVSSQIITFYLPLFEGSLTSNVFKNLMKLILIAELIAAPDLRSH